MVNSPLVSPPPNPEASALVSTALQNPFSISNTGAFQLNSPNVLQPQGFPPTEAAAPLETGPLFELYDPDNDGDDPQPPTDWPPGMSEKEKKDKNPLQWPPTTIQNERFTSFLNTLLEEVQQQEITADHIFHYFVASKYLRQQLLFHPKLDKRFLLNLMHPDRAKRAANTEDKTWYDQVTSLWTREGPFYSFTPQDFQRTLTCKRLSSIVCSGRRPRSLFVHKL